MCCGQSVFAEKVPGASDSENDCSHLMRGYAGCREGGFIIAIGV
jgi:hypothetical protein